MSQPARPSALDVWLEGDPAPVGWLRAGRDLSVSFAYRDAAAPSLSVRLTPRAEPFGDREARSFFDNLLPEGEPRAAIAAKHRLDTGDVFGLLAALGADAPGAVSVLPAGSPPVKSPGLLGRDYEPLDDGQLAGIVQAAAAGRVPGERLRFSLAGVQAKFAIAVEEGRYLAPRGGAPTTHIVKVERTDGRTRGIVANEFTCLEVFRRLGLHTVEARREAVAGIPCLVVTRYDRRREAGGAVHRLHQEDAAQVLGLDRSLKYQTDAEAAGQRAGLPELLGPFAAACRPAVDARDAILRAVFLNWLLGNSDSHAKNWAVVYAAARIAVPGLPRRPVLRLAPFYDVVCIAAYAEFSDDLAMRIGPDASWNSVQAEHWEAVARLAFGTRSRNAVTRGLQRLHDLAGQALPAIDAVVADGLVTRAEAKPIRDVIGSRLRHLNGTMGWGIPAATDAPIIRGGGWAWS